MPTPALQPAPPDVAASLDAVDRINADFYGRFPYPWRPRAIDAILEPDFSRRMLAQDVGDWAAARIPRAPAIWVAGCGTNQAVLTALNFPESQVVASDITGEALDAEAATAREVGADNLVLRQESLNHVTYREQFDYIVCTGVVHHAADPSAMLAQVARALKPDGVLELMVYNRHHRIAVGAAQRAINLLHHDDLGNSFDTRLATARAIIGELSRGFIHDQLGYLRQVDRVAVADVLLQPVEWTYDVQTFNDLVAGAGLTLLTYCANPYDAMEGRQGFNCRFRDAALQHRYDALPDVERWQVANLLRLDRAPMLWFYCARTDAPTPRPSDREMADRFLATRFVPTRAMRRRFILNPDSKYTDLPNPLPHPGTMPGPEMKAILEAVEPGLTMREVFRRAGAAEDVVTANEARLQLATSACPYLTAVGREPS
jgi:SAM-dependent methyltransferase